MSREYRVVEMRLVSEYCVSQYPKDRHFTRVRLGELHPSLHPERLSQEEQRMVGVFRRWADAVVLTRDRVIIIEGAILPDLGDVSKVEAYGQLFPYTAEFRSSWEKPVELVLVFAVNDPFVTTMATGRGIKVEIFRPSWIDEYLSTLDLRKRRAPLT